MTRLVDTFVAFDAATRAYAQAIGQSRAARRLRETTADLRRQLAAAALADEAAHPDPARSFEQLVEIAAAAGVDWHTMRDAFNRAHERNPRG